MFEQIPKSREGTQFAGISGNDIHDRGSSMYESPKRNLSGHVIVSAGEQQC